MKKQCLIAIGLIAVLALSACGNTSGQLQEGKKDDTSSNNVKANTDNLSGTQEDSTNSVTEDFLKTITAETAEAKGVCGNDLTWYYQDNVLVIKGTGEMSDFSGDDVPWYDCSKETGWIIIDEGVTRIGENAFSGCSNSLSKVVFPSTLESIGEDAFSGCEQLQDVIIPSSVTDIGNRAFSYLDEDDITFLGDIPGSIDSILGRATERPAM